MTTLVMTPGSGGQRPRIGYRNLLESDAATVTTDSEDADFAHQFLYDWLPHTYWKPATNGTHYVQAVFASPQAVDYFAFYSNTVYASSGTIKLQYSTDGGSTWSDAVTVAPTNDEPVFKTFTQILAARWRVTVTATPRAKLGVVAFGLSLQLERGDWIGFTPPELGRDTELTTIISDNGGFLGRSIIRKMWSSKLELDFQSFGFAYESWLPFMKHAERPGPFFLLWNENDYANRAAFCWASKKGDIVHPKITHRAMMSSSIRFSCIATE